MNMKKTTFLLSTLLAVTAIGLTKPIDTANAAPALSWSKYFDCSVSKERRDEINNPTTFKKYLESLGQKYSITVKGKSTHSAFPEKGIDPILIGAKIANACEEISARELPAGTAAVLSFGSFQAGKDHNTIPDTAVLRGSIRVQNVEVRNFMGERLKCICENLATAFKADCDTEIKRGSSTVMNEQKLSTLVAGAIADVLGEESVVIVPKGQMEKENFEIDDVVFLDDDGLIEQAYDKEDE